VHERRKKTEKTAQIYVSCGNPHHPAKASTSTIANPCGFSLAELLVVVVIVMLVGMTAVPSLLHSRLAANEAASISSIRNINRAEVSYQAAYPTRGFAAKLVDLGGAKPCTPSPSSACLIDKLLGEGAMGGYNFAAVGTRQAANGVYQDYTAGAAPVSYGQSGVRLFCSMSDAVLRYSANPTHSTTPPATTECLAEAVLE
jgi:type II secretory pathway pseudopilin PulG